MKYWEIIKAFEEGKTLRELGGKAWNRKDYATDDFIERLSRTYPEGWTIAKSDYDKALDKRKLLDEIEIKQGKDGEPRYILTQKQFDKLC